MVKFIGFLLNKIGVKFNAHKLKIFIDKGFIIVEKIITKLIKLIPFYLDFYEEILEKEIILADISKNDKIVHIGCGSIPATCILITKKTNASIIGIEKNEHSVKHAKQCVSQLNLSDKIEIKLSDASDFSIKNFDLIIIAQGITPYREILEKISKDIKKDARVVFRTSSKISGEFSENDLFLKDIFKIDKMVCHKQNSLLISILLQKK